MTPYDEVKHQANMRFDLERSGGGFWPFCVKLDGIELFRGHHKQCRAVLDSLRLAWLDGARIASHASHSKDAQ